VEEEMEPIRNNIQRLSSLEEYLMLLSKGPVTKEVFENYKKVLHSACAHEVNEVLDEVLRDAKDMDDWKQPVARFIRSVSRGLDSEVLPEYPADSLFANLEEENKIIEAELNALQSRLLQPRVEKIGQDSFFRGGIQHTQQSIGEIRKRIGDFTLLKTHYQRLQNELFPLFEQAASRHRCVSLMWALQDDVLALQTSLANGAVKAAEYPAVMSRAEATAETTDEAARSLFWKDLGAFYMTAGMLLYRERRILYPIAFREIPEHMLAKAHNAMSKAGSYTFSTLTGSLDARQLEAVFKNLPVDISFIGTDDRVKFYSDPPHRIFPRSPAVVGRLVQNCHPPKSVAVVEEILRSFKNGDRDSAEFWLHSKGAFIHIQYFALRDAEGSYLGTMEVSQNATNLRKLEGEKRLL
jgi:DUF438 domain-containing protein